MHPNDAARMNIWHNSDFPLTCSTTAVRGLVRLEHIADYYLTDQENSPNASLSFNVVSILQTGVLINLNILNWDFARKVELTSQMLNRLCKASVSMIDFNIPY